ncbi:hypothetical protein JCM10908_001411 [Rhodotorula pacifica]|uniref:diphosphomevalonate decarboxylase MVD1 n=1 Tax=Rhodotorula pacifica TaxID=1495444 RepID=UPI00316B9DBB
MAPQAAQVYEATCTAPVNIAVVKYWGKRDTTLILPTNSSLSVTLSQDHLRSLTSAKCITTAATTTGDRLWLNGEEEEIKEGGRTHRCLAELRKMRKDFESRDDSLPKLSTYPLHIASENNFPTAAGLASSASGLSALIATISTLYSLTPENGISVSDLSRIARQGSGSACRSMFGGYVAWEMGTRPDGHDSVAVEVAPASHWPDLHALILVVSDKKKGTPSTAGMQRTVATSDLLQHRIDKVVPARMERISTAILARDFDQFAIETMADSNQFHAVCLDTVPPIFYLNDVSRAVIQLVSELNRASVEAGKGYVAAYTYDAGPNAVLYVREKDVQHVLELVLRYFPQESFEDPFHLGPKPATDLPQGFNERVIPQHEKGSVARIIHTKVGDGPRVLGAEESLLNAEGFPKSLK